MDDRAYNDKMWTFPSMSSEVAGINKMNHTHPLHLVSEQMQIILMIMRGANCMQVNFYNLMILLGHTFLWRRVSSLAKDAMKDADDVLTLTLTVRHGYLEEHPLPQEQCSSARA